ncbi:uncharacterized protein LOC129951636 isoform X2 [Eupeodes corollae]|uniref:uncharacterized protein LOC129951636 isoform X2 n=1 Tax=Eupeodes corollae TaxID=290404 RepID=UPI002491B662|nr:uncharacterized protein LOC129951636 isoform X2 [Eupeodes corollae]
MSRIRIITASVRTTNRMNAILNESVANRRKSIFKVKDTDPDAAGVDNMHPKLDIQFLQNNFSMEKVYKLIEAIIEDRLLWDRLSRTYDSWRAVSLAENLASEIRNRIKELNYKRHRIVCILSLIEKQNQGISIKMNFLMDSSCDNFTKFIYERATYTIVVTVFLVHKD